MQPLSGKMGNAPAEEAASRRFVSTRQAVAYTGNSLDGERAYNVE